MSDGLLLGKEHGNRWHVTKRIRAVLFFFPTSSHSLSATSGDGDGGGPRFRRAANSSLCKESMQFTIVSVVVG